MFRYILFHKPYHVMSQFSKEGTKKTLADFLPGIPNDVYPVGRLDYDSEGLLILTNDKGLTHELLDPEKGHRRRYLVQVEGLITPEALAKLCQGVRINHNGKLYQTKSASAIAVDEPADLAARTPPVRFRKHIPTSWITLELTEGKNRQVRKMTAAAGFPTLRLVRVAIGSVTLGGLLPGQYREEGSSLKERLLR